MDWPLRIEPFLLFLIATGGLFVLAAVVLYFRKRRQLRRARGSLPNVKNIIAPYEQQKPAFFRIVQSYLGEDDEGELLAKEEICQALLVLAAENSKRGNGKAKRRKKKDLGSSLLDLSVPHASNNRQSEAAMLTIVRSIYFDSSLRGRLGRELEQETDRLLDSLTASRDS